MIPPRSVLATIDFSASSRTALCFAARLARHCGATLHVLHVQNPLLVAAAATSGVDLAHDTLNELRRFVEGAVTPGTSPVHYHVVTGNSAPAICNVAQREQSDLIVIGMHGMSGVEHAMFGSTTEGVLQKAGTSVLVVPDRWTPPRSDLADLTGIGPVVAGVECCEPAIAGAAAAARMAALLGTSLELRHVVPELPVLQRWRTHADAAVTQAIEEARRELSGLIPTLGATVPVTLHVETGRVAETIARALAPTTDRNPLLVLGRRNRPSHLGGPGATAYRVLALSKAPVLVHLPG